jgi:hypothetical protein
VGFPSEQRYGVICSEWKEEQSAEVTDMKQMPTNFRGSLSSHLRSVGFPAHVVKKAKRERDKINK